jgi:hypothetical protein
MVIVAVENVEAQPPEAATVFVTVYVPGVLDARFTSPVVALMNNPGPALNVPVLAPAFIVGDGFIPVWQYGVPV